VYSEGWRAEGALLKEGVGGLLTSKVPEFTASLFKTATVALPPVA